jgi:hypothetical protein
MSTKPLSEKKASSPSGAGKRAYVRPDFQSEKVLFERNALACGKLSATQQSCKFNRKNS